MSALIAILLGAGGGIGLGSIGPVGVGPVLKALPTLLKVAKIGLEHMPVFERAATKREIAAIEKSAAAQATLGRWFR